MLPIFSWIVLTGCGRLSDPITLADHLNPAGPCFEVDLGDGLSEEDGAEVHALFDCVNGQGHLESLAATVDSLDTETRSGKPGTEVFAAWVNRLPEADVDPFALVGLAYDALQVEDRPVDALFDLGLELIAGVPAEDVWSGEVDLDDPAALRQGVLAPWGELVRPAARTMLDDDLESAGWLADKIAQDSTRRWIRTLGAWTESKDPAVAPKVDGLVVHLGEMIGATQVSQNDRWDGSTGDSLRDVAVAYTHGANPLLGRVGPEMVELLGDETLKTELEEALVELEADGTLAEVPAQLVWLASVDTDGSPLQGDEPSALYRFVRLLGATNRTTTCTVDLGLFDFDLNADNIALSVLSILADLDPDTVQSGIGILSDVIGWDLSGWILDEVADSGLCDTITPEVIDDLKAIDAIYQPEAYELLVVFVEGLHIFKYADDDRLPALADLATKLHNGGGVEPLEELIRDVGEETLVTDVIDLVPVLADPERYDLAAGDEPAVNLRDALDALIYLWVEDEGRTGWDRMGPLAVALSDEDGMWEGVHRFGALAADERSRTSTLVELVPTLLSIDPELEILDQFGPLFGDPELAEPLLELLESEDLAPALFAVSRDDEGQVPLAFVGRLIRGGALEDLLSLVDLAIDKLLVPLEESP